MRRFSQRNSLVTLSDINITPLLDLAFVLLIIFIITTPLLEQSLPVNLPKGGAANADIDPKNVKTVEITPAGVYALNGVRITPVELERRLVDEARRNPNLIVAIRADREGAYKYLYDVINRCKRNGILKFNFQSEPER